MSDAFGCVLYLTHTNKLDSLSKKKNITSDHPFLPSSPCY